MGSAHSELSIRSNSMMFVLSRVGPENRFLTLLVFLMNDEGDLYVLVKSVKENLR